MSPNMSMRERKNRRRQWGKKKQRPSNKINGPSAYNMDIDVILLHILYYPHVDFTLPVYPHRAHADAMPIDFACILSIWLKR